MTPSLSNPCTNRPLVCIQGLGFVGAAMAVAVANAQSSDGLPCYDVVGVDLANGEGLRRIQAINNGHFPFETVDQKLTDAIRSAHANGNLRASSDEEIYCNANVVVVDIPLDISQTESGPQVDFSGFRKAMQSLGSKLPKEALVVVETTVPPGTCEKVVAPILEACLLKRGMSKHDILIAHSYERIMPGAEYYDSLVNFWRVYSGTTPQAATACEQFLSTVLNTEDYPLKQLESTTASETGKVLENSYRAVNIAFMEEWGRFAENAGIDLFEVIDAIRVRPTHSNMRQPGFGVGGYCLTKDPLFTPYASRHLFNLDNLDFPFSQLAVSINNSMPLNALDSIRRMLGGTLDGKKILLLGVSYRSDVGDTRKSPSELFVRKARQEGAVVACHDPLVAHWQELDLQLEEALPSPASYDAIVFAVAHREYMQLDLSGWLNSARPSILDANCVLTKKQRDTLKDMNIPHSYIGRGI